jgi:hypothetical protein
MPGTTTTLPKTTMTPAPSEQKHVAVETPAYAGDISADGLINKSVKNAANEQVGNINDLLIDNSGKIAAVIVGVGGFLGIGQKDVALPLTAFVVMPANSGENKTNSDELKLSMTKDQLQQMAEFKPLQPASTVGAGSPTGSRPAPSPMSPANPNR